MKLHAPSIAISIAMAAAILLPWAGAQAGPSEAMHSAASAASGVATKTENAVKRGVKKTTNAVAHGAHVAGSAVSRGAKKVGLPTGPASGPVKGPQSTQP